MEDCDLLHGLLQCDRHRLLAHDGHRLRRSVLYSRDDHGNGIPNGNGNPMGFPWERELVTKLGMGRNGKQPVWEWEWPLFPWESIPIGGYSVKLM